MNILYTIPIFLKIFIFISFGFILKVSEKDAHIRFKIKNAGITVEGEFEKFTAEIKYNKANPEKSSFKGVIEVNSINTGIKMRDHDLQKKGYFDAANYPEITFNSTNVKRIKPNTLEVTGNLTIKATTKKIVMQVLVNESGGKTIYTTGFNLNRRDYGVGGNSWILADELTVDLKITP